MLKNYHILCIHIIFYEKKEIYRKNVYFKIFTKKKRDLGLAFFIYL